jgi:hypothetical protein
METASAGAIVFEAAAGFLARDAAEPRDNRRASQNTNAGDAVSIRKNETCGLVAINRFPRPTQDRWSLRHGLYGAIEAY